MHSEGELVSSFHDIVGFGGFIVRFNFLLSSSKFYYPISKYIVQIHCFIVQNVNRLYKQGISTMHDIAKPLNDKETIY